MVVLDFLKSGFMFFFRWPIFTPSKYYHSSIVLGSVFQSLIFFACTYTLNQLNFSQHTLFAFVVLSVWTGFFHDDGFADTCDSLGVVKYKSSEEKLSKENIEKIKSAMKDSRLGTFGVSALILMWLVRYLACQNSSFGIYYSTAIVALSRSSGLLFAKVVSKSVGTRHEGIAFTHIVVFVLPVFAFAFLFLLLNFEKFSAVVLLQVLLPLMAGFSALKWLAHRTEELNGDIIGASIILLELLLLLSFI